MGLFRKNSVELNFIGMVENNVTELKDTDWEENKSLIRMKVVYAAGTAGLETFSHAIIITYLHAAEYEAERHLQRHPRGNKNLPKMGIFAQRAKDRPNPLGVSVVEILEIECGNVLVKGLDAVNGTPVLDIKPYVPVFDRVENARVPGWVEEIMQGYF
ncbi:MAG: tRNA (N6-threonylcarbamoyladenosine(37)-N6)-methyltransferase TrmO [Anaerolineales bacterium]|nr:tRNA (N6-threonylcarbamoyladenosine(37)-N6)-methyltransferase TrmO [Anaerolineales bacterium]